MKKAKSNGHLIHTLPSFKWRDSWLAMVVALLLIGTSGLRPAKADYVGGLNPYGDNFLTLRQYASSQSRPLARMPPNTILEVLDADGVWYYVRTESGLEGWAHSKWIYPGYPSGRQGPQPGRGTPSSQTGSDIDPNAPPASDWDDQPINRPIDRSTNQPINPSVQSPPVERDPLDWVQSHMEQFHDPLKF